MTNCTTCAVNDGYKPAEALQQIGEPVEALRLAKLMRKGETFSRQDYVDTADMLEAQHARIAALEAELAALKAAPAETPFGYIHPQNIARLMRGEAVAIRKHGWDGEPGQLAVYTAAPAALAAPQAQDVQDAETLHLARVAVSESEGCSFPQDWMEAAIKVCKSVIAASAKGGV